MSVAGTSQANGSGHENGAARTPSERPHPRIRLGRKEKQRLQEKLPVLPPEAPPTAAAVVPVREDGIPATDAWSWFPLVDRNSATCPVLFNADCSYAFIAVGTAVRIYSVATAELLSTLSVPAITARSAKVTALLLNPSNPLQLVVGALDGMLRVWDYVEGKLIRTLALGAPVQFACGHSVIRDQVFVSLFADDPPPTKKELRQASTSTSTPLPTSEQKAGVYAISLKPKALDPSLTPSGPISPLTPRHPSRRTRLAQPRIIKSLSISPSGAFLISLNPTEIHICRTKRLLMGFSQRLESVGEEVFTCLKVSPSEDCFVTGNTDGKIRAWYGVLNKDEEGQEMKSAEGKKSSTTSVFHWHAHAVNCLEFTPNGAYLVSGGEESVLVLWQLHSGHKEFVPRVGAPIVTVSVSGAGKGEQQIVARLRDGSVVFVGSQKLKISNIISGLKADPIRLSESERQAFKRPKQQVPLALQPLTNSLVIPSGHPSSLQFYSPSSDAQLLELEISPSNRVTAAGAPIEPTRVERVAFSTPADDAASKGKANYWMATQDSWESGSFSSESHLKFWQYKNDGSSFALTTRIDRPHEDKITSFSFSPSSTSPILLTTSNDGFIKLWSHQSNSSWRCRTSLSYRSLIPLSSAWSKDGSMFAVALSSPFVFGEKDSGKWSKNVVTLWNLSDGKLIKTFTSLGVVDQVEFVGKEGTTLLAAGKRGTIAWDLLTFDETFTSNLEVNTLSTRPQSSTFFASERPSLPPPNTKSPPSFTIDTYLVDPASPSSPSLTHKTLPFPIKQSIFLDSLVASSSSALADELSLAVVDEQGDVILVGGSGIKSFEKDAGATKLSEEVTSQTRLFDEIFGKTDAFGPAIPGIDETSSQVVTSIRPGKRNGLEVLDAPAHTLPPARLLWKTMLSSFATLPSPAPEVETLEKEEETTAMEVDEEVESEAEVVYSSVDKLAEVFKAKISFGAAGVATSSTAPRKG